MMTEKVHGMLNGNPDKKQTDIHIEMGFGSFHLISFDMHRKMISNLNEEMILLCGRSSLISYM